MFLISEADFFARKYRIFESQRLLKSSGNFCRIWGGVDLVAAGRMRLQSYDANGGGGGYQRRRTS